MNVVGRLLPPGREALQQNLVGQILSAGTARHIWLGHDHALDLPVTVLLSESTWLETNPSNFSYFGEI
jgi:hypothetical protein